MNFAHLHVHTEYSLLDGSNKIKEYVARVKELGMNSAAITDHGVMYGVIDFYREARKQGINPIIGCEVYVAPNSRFDREIAGGEDRYYHLVLLAENNVGYANLMKIVSKGFVDGYYYKPRVDKEVLREYHEGIIALSACLAGEVQRYLVRELYDEARKTAKEYEDIFGKGNFFLELQDHGIPEQGIVNPRLLRMSEELGIDLVATNDVHYTYAEDEKPHDILLCIQTGKKLADENRMRYTGGQYYVKSPEEMAELFPYALQALDNTQRIADRCNVEIEFGVTKLPKFDVPDGLTSLEYLNKLCYEGLERRYPNPSQELRDRLKYELNTITTMGYVDYFLIVWDFIRYAKDHGIAVGPGRGSAAGSIVSYCLEITNIDPIRYQLLFERFLNPERVSMPDIDIDFCYERRQEVIDYVVRKYGKDRVVQIVTFGTLQARGVLRDVGRVMDLPYAFVDNIAKLIPKELNITIDKSLKMEPELRKLYETDEQVKYLIDMAKRLEGLPRHTSMHAAGVVISQKSVDEYVPLSRASDGSITTQFTMTTLEELGLLKMDFLGLRTLTVIQNAVDLVNRRSEELSGGQAIPDIANIDYDDKAVLASVGTGRTDGVFQLESGGMKGFMKELKPQNLEDIIAGISLYRPGPMDFIPQYIKGKNSQGAIQYDCPQLEPILKPTYGCIVYQEQVMQIVQELAGYTLGRADMVRRAMSKKKGDVMKMERQNFVYGNDESGVPGCVKNGIDEKVANKIYDDMIDFAKYAFNKSHAAAYAVVSYQTAYLKYYYPVEFMAALMTSVIDNPPKVAEYIYACRQMGIKILPPDVNKGEARFSVDYEELDAAVAGHGAAAGEEIQAGETFDHEMQSGAADHEKPAAEKKMLAGIRYGLAAIKNVGRPVIQAIVEDREEYGLFKNLEDFISRLSVKDALNKRCIENFIKAGALDSLQGTRKQFMSIYLQIVDHVNQEKKYAMTGQMTLFDMVDDDQKKDFEIQMPDVGEYSKETMLSFEKEVLGIYVSGHPLEAYEEQWKRTISAKTLDFQLDDETGVTKVRDGAKEIVGGMIVDKTIKYTKTNQTMAFITIEDLVGTVEVVVFPRDYEKNKSFIEADSKVFVQGRVSEEDDKPSKLICEKIVPFGQTKKELWIQFPDKDRFLKEEQILYGYLADSDGNDEVVIYCQAEKAIKRLPRSRNIQIEPGVLGRLMNLYGEKRVKVVEKAIENRI
ncbi:DNA polymerase III subunit alpha [Hespellia stercorisuis]|uniref:DNA polymerase III subunit alpha n=1 Tax=Hespellia stercorisuis DSM 15480 TaxID=1121950 RepID=A0A1M6QKP1_9FIRM|nr:DNA polymerase III subunit alpha [Hespellia stercorisuis]SHK20859.1 DNA polymerase III catalytic subunit, DnaE type [Hespellia stercorisuis DSM 15480]